VERKIKEICININKKDLIIGILVRLPALLIMLASIYLSSLPHIPALSGIRISDKLIHLVCFAGLAGSWTFWFSLNSWKKHSVRNILICVIGVALYGILDEWHQSFTPHREVSAYDWLADVGGAILGSISGCFLMKLLAKSPRAAERKHS
jgi:VanZ family protein